MKKINVFKKMMVMFLTFTLLLTIMGQPVIAVTKNETIDKQGIRLAIETYQKLTPEAKKLFEKELKNDSQLLEFHKMNVKYANIDDKSMITEVDSMTNSLSVLSTDLLEPNLYTDVTEIDPLWDLSTDLLEPNLYTDITEIDPLWDLSTDLLEPNVYTDVTETTPFSDLNTDLIESNLYPEVIETAEATAATAANPLSVLSKELVRLNLPVAVRYTLMAMGGGLVAAGIDGPLPVGDLIAAVIAIGGVAVLAYYWTDISPKWDSIVNAFKKAFSPVASKVVAVFAGISITVDQYITKPYQRLTSDTMKITIKGKTLTITKDTSLKPAYFFAVRDPKGGIKPVMPINYATALAIMKLGWFPGIGKAYQEGVYCVNGKYAAGKLAEATSTPGFDDGRGSAIEAPHFHPGSSWSRNWGTHAWYALK